MFADVTKKYFCEFFLKHFVIETIVLLYHYVLCTYTDQYIFIILSSGNFSINTLQFLI